MDTPPGILERSSRAMASSAITEPTKAGTRRTASASRMMRRRQRAGLLFVLPSVVFVSCFFLLPLALTAWMSLNNWTIFLPVVIGLGTASFLRTWLYNDQVGAIDGLLNYLHLIRAPIAWFNDARTGLMAVVIMIVWKTGGFAMLLFLVGMQAIPTELYEAARVDGAGFWRQLISIMLPLLRRTFALILVLIVTGSYLAFDHFYIMTHGGPANQTLTTVMRIVEAGFTNFQLGYAGALSITLLLILLIINVVQLFIMRGTPED